MKLITSLQTLSVILMLSWSVNGDIDGIFDDTKFLKDLSTRYNLLVYKVNDAVFTRVKLVNGVLDKTPELSKEIEGSISKYGFSALKNVSRIIQKSEALECVSKPSSDIREIAQQGGKSYQKCVDDLNQRFSTFPEVKSKLDSFIFSKKLSTITTEILNCRQSLETRATCENKTLENFATFVKKAESRVEQFVATAEDGVVILLKCYDDSLNQINKVNELLKQIKACVLKYDILLDLNLINPPSFPELLKYQKASTSKPDVVYVNTLVSASAELELLYNKIAQKNVSSFLQDALVNVVNSNLQGITAYIAAEQKSANLFTTLCLKLAALRVEKIRKKAFKQLDQLDDISVVKTEKILEKLIADVKKSLDKTYGNHVQLRNEKQNSVLIDKDLLEIISNLRNKDGKLYGRLFESVFSSIKNIVSKISVSVTDIQQKLRICYYRFRKITFSV